MPATERLRRFLRIASLFAALVFAQAAHALSAPDRTGFVTDEAGILDSATESALSDRLSALQQATGAEVIVVTLAGLQHVSIETWGDVLGQAWSVGRSGGRDRGILLIVAPNDRKVRIAVGYGLSNRLPDSAAAIVISYDIIPRFRAGDFAGGVVAGVAGIAAQLDRQSGSAVQVERSAAPIPIAAPGFWHRWKPAVPILLILLVVALVVFFIIRFAWNANGEAGPGGGWDVDDDTDSGTWTGRRRRSRWDRDDNSSSRGWSSDRSSSDRWSGGSSSGGSARASGGATGSW